jgi:hypothetical protein
VSSKSMLVISRARNSNSMFCDLRFYKFTNAKRWILSDSSDVQGLVNRKFNVPISTYFF